MKKLAILALALSLSACGFTPQGDLARDVVRERGAQAYDEGLENGLWFMCRGASVGSIRRKFGASRDLMAAYNTLCSELSFDLGDVPPARP